MMLGGVGGIPNKTGVRLIFSPLRLSDQHGPVELALDVSMARAAGMDEGVDCHQDKALSVQFPDLNRQLSDR